MSAVIMSPDSLADALRELGLENHLLPLKAIDDRQMVLAYLKTIGVSKLGQRMKIMTLVLNGEPAQPASQPVLQPSQPTLQPPPPSEPQRHGQRGAVPAPPVTFGQPSAAIGYFEVVCSAVKVRSMPSPTADVINYKKQRAIIETDTEQNGFVRLAERFGSKEQWIMVDGTPLGLGLLLKRVPASARWRDEEDEKMEARVTDRMVEDWADDLG